MYEERRTNQGALERVLTANEDSLNKLDRGEFRQNAAFSNNDQDKGQGLYTSHVDDPMIPDLEISTNDVLKV